MPVFVKLTESPVHCGAVEVKDDLGVTLMVTVEVEVAEQLPSLMVKVMFLVPDVL